MSAGLDRFLVAAARAGLRQRLARLAQDLDEAIARLSLVPVADELIVRRLTKRKLLLKDRLVAIERLLDPNELA